MLFVSIITFVAAVLQIILFFKVWGMCNNVKRMTSHFCGEEKDEDDFNARIAAEDKSVGNDVRKQLLSELRAVMNKAQGMVEEDYERAYGSTPDKDIFTVLEKYQKIYSKLGEPFPKEIAKIKSLDDLWEIFD